MPAADADVVHDDELARLFECVSQHGHIALAVSGGPDSMALALLARRWAQRRAVPIQLTALVVDHSLRAASAKEARLAARRVRGLGLHAEILTRHGEVPASGLQAIARAERYALMLAWCRENGAEALLTGHTLDDQAETVVMRLKRGSGLDGLGAMSRTSWRSGLALVRPLLDVRRQQLLATLRLAGVLWIDDPSNHDTGFERVAVRKAMPDLARLGITTSGLARTAYRLNRARDALDAASDDLRRASVETFSEGFCKVGLASLLDAPDEVRIRLMIQLLGVFGGQGDEPVSLSAAERLCAWVCDGSTRARTLAGCRVARRKGELVIGREAGRMTRELQPLRPGRSELWDNRFFIKTDCEDLSVAALGSLGDCTGMARGLDVPGFVRATLPALVRDGAVVGVPHAAFMTDRAFATDVSFCAVSAW